MVSQKYITVVWVLEGHDAVVVDLCITYFPTNIQHDIVRMFLL